MNLKYFFKNNLRLVLILIVISISSSVLFINAYNYYNLLPLESAKIGAKYAATKILRFIYLSDLNDNQKKLNNYWIGSPHLVAKLLKNKANPPFIYEELDEPYLQDLRHEFELLNFLGSESNEYETQLKLASWLGTRWDHGTSQVHGGKEQIDPLKLIKEGEKGAKFWCEIAAIVTVQTATALGWPARLIALSRDGYTMEHGVAELWSNYFNKWYVVDTDFNVVFERQGIPLSAFELCHFGLELKKKGHLHLNFFSPAKPSLPYQDLLPFYHYVFVDLRNDWLSRDLPRGSPAGGDYATMWTARKNSKPLLTLSQREDRRKRFDWPVNQTWILVSPNTRGTTEKTLHVAGYSPYFKHFELQIDDGSWQPLPAGTFTYQLTNSEKKIAVRMVTTFNHCGPTVYWQMIQGDQTPKIVPF